MSSGGSLSWRKAREEKKCPFDAPSVSILCLPAVTEFTALILSHKHFEKVSLVSRLKLPSIFCGGCLATGSLAGAGEVAFRGCRILDASDVSVQWVRSSSARPQTTHGAFTGWFGIRLFLGSARLLRNQVFSLLNDDMWRIYIQLGEKKPKWNVPLFIFDVRGVCRPNTVDYWLPGN